jgi:nucleotide-binding universal stress UspA family protein/nitrite reductase/ring-hydroxylating ferredoxin subunit
MRQLGPALYFPMWVRKAPLLGMGYRKIVVGTDGSKTAALAERVARRLARAGGSELLIISAYDPPASSRALAEKVLVEAQARARADGVEAGTEARAGDPGDVIMEVADTNGADLIVVGNVGMGGARRFVLGGIPDRVSHYSPCDLLIVKTADRDPTTDRPTDEYRRVLIATDGSPTADQAARRGADLAESLGASITFVFVGDPLEGNIVLEEAAKRLGTPEAEGRVLQGDPSDAICELAVVGDHDLVVVGNKGMAGARRYLLGAVPNKVSHDAPVDVLIAKTVGRSLEDLKPGEGAVVVAGGRKVAAYRDQEGTVHAVSARCTHMGCTVGWNDAALTWDCPCHGSRYALDGKVIHGPAEQNLTPIGL